MKPAVRIQELKNKLIILGHEFFATKKINESLYRKLKLITYSRTTEQKLKDSYKNLKDIDNSIKQSESSPSKDKTKPKKKTLKDFKENKKTIDDDANILYNTYIKYKTWNIIDKATPEHKHYKLFINSINEEIHTLWRIEHSTLQSYGKKNIINEIQQFIELILKNTYTHKIKILDVHVNKEIYQPKQYRYLGGRRSLNKKEGYIKYFKAWNATFSYNGFNLDMNNDIEYECVPSTDWQEVDGSVGRFCG